MKPFLAFVFFLISTVILGVGCYMAAAGLGNWLLLLGVVGYLGLFIKEGCWAH
jgi:hypothetical protein